MPKRTVRTGVATYLGADGMWRFGVQGATVDVHPDDLARFDRLNPDAPSKRAGAK